MKFQNAVEADVNSIMNIINQAQAYFKEHAINQWQDNYPNFEIVMNDINNKNGHVLLEDNNVVGITFIFGKLVMKLYLWLIWHIAPLDM